MFSACTMNNITSMQSVHDPKSDIFCGYLNCNYCCRRLHLQQCKVYEVVRCLKKMWRIVSPCWNTWLHHIFDVDVPPNCSNLIHTLLTLGASFISTSANRNRHNHVTKKILYAFSGPRLRKQDGKFGAGKFLLVTLKGTSFIIAMTGVER